MKVVDYFLLSVAFFVAFLVLIGFGLLSSDFSSYAGFVVNPELTGYDGYILFSHWLSLSASAVFAFGASVGFLVSGLLKRFLMGNGAEKVEG